ncbi:hypothetical protein Q2K19_06650 [Micromonospora soli]|uniref:hypothetical protein n=1 Tax=Micromonospora sp. NBRC 110009 TaxID=3061627 RepID=UPI00267119C2|nr:hypothetical protein [Micromonospora sp. NBRC 110009]WKU00162.1 hypothetical protein Q2K19_06650 [Micromonospora sp. NBRC 110009]
MIDIELLMDELGRRQVDVMIRVDTKTLPDALDYCLADLATYPGDWVWLDAYRGLPRS